MITTNFLPISHLDRVIDVGMKLDEDAKIAGSARWSKSPNNRT